MRYSIRSILLCIFLLAIALGSVATYERIWKSHCRSYEASIYAFLLREKIDELIEMQPPEFEHEGVRYNVDKAEPIVCFAVGQNGNRDWIPPSEALMQEIALANVQPFVNLDEKVGVYCIHNIRWLDWETVLIDYGTYYDPLSAHGANNVKLRLVDGEWQYVDAGSAWLS